LLVSCITVRYLDDNKHSLPLCKAARYLRSHAPRQRQATIFDACLAAVMRGIMLLIAAIANELRIRRDMRQLAAMDDQMLKDIGLRRGEIEYCVRYGRDG
jgi:uncharacterized protein YjiS (DUF1127 family)